MRIQPIHAAAAGGHLALVQALLEKGVDPNARQQGGYTPLHQAAQRGDVEMAHTLLHYGADRSVRDENGRLPLDLALENKHKAVADLLRQA